MKLERKIAIGVLLPVILSLAVLGWFAMRYAVESVHMTMPRYVEVVLDTYMTQDIESRAKLLEDNGLDIVPSFVTAYQREALDAAHHIRFPFAGRIIVLNEQGRILFRTDAQGAGITGIDWNDLALDFAQSGQEEGVGHFAEATPDDFYAWRHFAPWGWYVVMAVDDRTAHDSAARIKMLTIGIGVGAVFLVALIVTAVLRGFVVRPVRRLREAATAIAASQPVVEVPVHSKDELSDLARDIETMSRQLTASRESLVRWNKELQDTVLAQHQDLEHTSAGLESAIAQRRTLEEELLFTQFAMDHAPLAILQADSRGIFSYVNLAAAEIYGSTPQAVVGTYVGEWDSFFSDKDVWDEYWRTVKQAGQRHYERDLSETVSPRLGVEIRSYYIQFQGQERVVSFVADISERIRTREVLVQSEKMLSVGGLAAGMAHEINNPLAGIIGSGQILRKRLLGDMPRNQEVAMECGIAFEGLRCYLEKRGLVRNLDALLELGQRAASIVSNMLEFVRPGDSRYEPHNLTELLDRALEVCQSDYDLGRKYDFRKVEVEREYDPGVPPVLCDRGALEQVFVNILRNGAQAMAEGSRADAPALVLRVRPDGDHVRVEIEDNGPGMSDEVRKRAFEPFFTTKGPQTGTGLGLSISYFVVTSNHKGTIEVHSDLGKGARFVMRFPQKLQID